MLRPIYALCWGIEYETNSVSNYGRITGNIVNSIPEEFITSFFPDAIDETWQDVNYHYKAIQGDTYAYECYLEFTVDNPTDYFTILQSYVGERIPTTFLYDSSFAECSVSNVLSLQTDKPNQGIYPIDFAEIGKILYRTEDRRIIFWALGTYDGGSTDTSELSYFFERFCIDVIDYQLNAYYCFDDQELGITYEERYALGMPTSYPYPR